MFLSFLIALFAALTICSALFLILFPILSQRTFVFHDFIIETIARTGFDIQSQLSFFWLLLFFGIFCLVGTSLIGHRLFREKKQLFDIPLPTITLVAVFPLLINLILYGKLNPVLTLGLFYLIGVLLLREKLRLSICEELLMPLLIYYSILALLTVLYHFTDRLTVTKEFLYIVAGGITLLLHIFTKETIQKILLGMECLIPLLLFVYFVDCYRYQGKLIHVRYAPFYYLFFGILILVLLGFSIWHMQSFEKKERQKQKLVCASTAITVFIYNSFSAAPLYAQPDQHHHGEQLIPWQQIVTLSQSAYDEYTPVSGLFPMVNGFVQNVLMRGNVSDYSPAISITMVLFCILTMVLIYLHVGGNYAFLFAIFFALPSYNRQYMVLPVLLLLFLPRLMEKPALWLLTWIYSCFFAGLYYPLYGAGILIGTLPLGLKMLIAFRKQTGNLEQNRTFLPITRLTLCLLPILFSIPLLFRILNHTLTYSSQTQAADGITLFGQQPPAHFLPYITSHETLRQWLYLTYRFLMPMLAVWLFILLLIHTIKKEKEACFFLVAGSLTLCISYTYTLVRADTNMILSRTAPIMVSVLGIFLPVLLLSFTRQKKSLCDIRILMVVLGISFSVPSMIYHNVSDMKFPDMWIYPNGEATLILDDTDKLFSYYDVPDFFVKMDELPLLDKSKLGNGFMVSDQVSYLTQYESVINKCKQALKNHATSDVIPEISYLGFDGQGFYYYLNAKACATGFIQAGKSYEAQQKMLIQIKKQQPVIFLLEPQCSYYIYTWMLTNGYVYCQADGAFYPHALYCLIYDEPLSKTYLTDGTTDQEAGNPSLYANGMIYGDDYRKSCPATSFGKVCSSFGSSFDSLRPLLTSEDDSRSFAVETSPNTSSIPDLQIEGQHNDVLYLEWKQNDLYTLYKDCVVAGYDETSPLLLTISFLSDEKAYESAKVTCQIDNKNLLIPMGMNATWFLGTNSQLTISISDELGREWLSMPFSEFEKKYLSKASFFELAKER